MRRIWAGWRMKYIEQLNERKRRGEEEECLFCAKLGEEDGPDNLILLRGPLALVMLNAYPYNPGHLMVAPRRHVAALRDLTREESCELMELLGRCEDLLAQAVVPDGFNVGINLGRAAGAGVPGHLHIHLVPRWLGDTNFMPLVAETKVMVEDLADTFIRLRQLLAEGNSRGRDE